MIILFYEHKHTRQMNECGRNVPACVCMAQWENQANKIGNESAQFGSTMHIKIKNVGVQLFRCEQSVDYNFTK